MAVDTVMHDADNAVPPSPDAVIAALHELVSPKYLNQDTATMHVRSSALFARLKALNRATNVAARAHKQVTADARTEMDQTHLGLQNLLYEKRHLEREIDKCRQFASVYQDIPIYPLEQFLESAPEDLKSPEAVADEHQLMLNRLAFELRERQALDQKRKELLQQKEELLRQSKIKATTMDNVKGQIDMLVKTASDIQRKVEDLVRPPKDPNAMQVDTPTSTPAASQTQSTAA